MYHEAAHKQKDNQRLHDQEQVCHIFGLQMGRDFGQPKRESMSSLPQSSVFFAPVGHAADWRQEKDQGCCPGDEICARC